MQKTRHESDSHFLIGRAHLNAGKPCQDFALSGCLSGGAAFAIIADGCSTGGHTDVGAKILALAAKQAIAQHWFATGRSIGTDVPKQIASRQRLVTGVTKTTLELTTADLLATCVYAFISPEGGCIHVQGDGVFAYVHMDGSITMTRFDWENNTPCYQVYEDDGFQTFIKAHGGDTSAHKLTSQTVTLDTKGVPGEFQFAHHALEQGIRGITTSLTTEMMSDITYIAVFSDGVTQVEGLAWHTVVQQLLSFKSTLGMFAARRLIRFVKDAGAHGKGPMDDIACAVIKIVPEIELQQQ